MELISSTFWKDQGGMLYDIEEIISTYFFRWQTLWRHRNDCLRTASRGGGDAWHKKRSRTEVRNL